MMECKEEGALTSTMEDYLEAVWSIEDRDRVPRVKDVSELMNVTPPTVNSAMKCLKKRGLIEQENYGYIKLTDEGRRIAVHVRKRHELFRRFFEEVLKLDTKTAEKDACRVEHNVSPATVQRIVDFLDFICSTSEGRKPEWLSAFHSGFAD